MIRTMNNIPLKKKTQVSPITDRERWDLWNRILNNVRRAYDMPVRPAGENPYGGGTDHA